MDEVRNLENSSLVYTLINEAMYDAILIKVAN